MTVKYTKESAFRPIITFFTWWLHNVKNDRDSILIIVSDYPLVSICSITRNNAILSNGTLGLLKVW
jgi:hypothetical protein